VIQAIPATTLDGHHDTARLFLAHHQLPEGPADGDLLRRILAAFARIPYENISKLIKLNETRGEWDRLRWPAEVWADYRARHLGGTCYSLTFFLWAILDGCGYAAAPLVMDMKWSPAAHCGLRAELADGPCLLDPGYLLGEPLPLHGATSVRYDNYTGVELRHDAAGDVYELYTFTRRERQFRYRFTPAPLCLDEFLVYWKDSFYQKSMRHICLTRLDPATRGRIYVRNEFIRHYTPAGKENMKLTLEEAAARYFDIPPELVRRARRYLP